MALNILMKYKCTEVINCGCKDIPILLFFYIFFPENILENCIFGIHYIHDFLSVYMFIIVLK